MNELEHGQTLGFELLPHMEGELLIASRLTVTNFYFMYPSCQRLCGTGTELFGGKCVSQQAAEDDHLRARGAAIYT